MGAGYGLTIDPIPCRAVALNFTLEGQREPGRQAQSESGLRLRSVASVSVTVRSRAVLVRARREVEQRKLFGTWGGEGAFDE